MPDFRRLVVAVQCVERSYSRMQTVDDLRDHIREGGEWMERPQKGGDDAVAPNAGSDEGE
jgi:hypothetical protein